MRPAAPPARGMLGTETSPAPRGPVERSPTVSSTVPPHPETMRASVLTGPGDLHVEHRPVPVPDRDQVLVRVASVGVCGSDVHYYREGRIGDYVVEAPMILGHEASGRIAAVGADVDPARVGQRVSIEPQRCCRVCAYCKRGEYNLCPDIEFYATPPIDGAFCDYVLIQDDFAHPIPDALSDDAAALLEPLSVGIAAIGKARVGVGSRVLVAGAGPIGVIAAQVARAYGASTVVVTDPVPGRRDLAARLGATATAPPGDPALDGHSFDAFLDATGVSAAIRDGIHRLAPGGVAVLVGMGEDDMVLPVGFITSREISVTGIFRYHGTWPAAIDLVATGRVDLDSLVTSRFGLDDVAAALDVGASPTSMKHIVCP